MHQSPNPLLTVVIPTIDRATLQRAIDSVLEQTIPCELVVEHDPARTGCGPTLNRALAKVRTSWMAGLADDDVFLPTFARRVADHAEQADMVIFRMQYPEGHWLPVVGEVSELAEGNVGSSFAVRTEIARRIGYMTVPCEGSGKAEDWEMISAVRDAGHRILIVPEVQVLLNPAGGSGG